MWMQMYASAGAAASYHLAQISAMSVMSIDARVVALVGGIVALFLAIKKVFDTPSRTYDPDNPNVGDEYDSWTE